MSNPAVSEGEALDILNAVLHALIDITPEAKTAFIDAERTRIITNLKQRYVGFTLDIVAKGKYGFQVKSVSHTDPEQQRVALEHLRGEVKNWESQVETSSNNLAKTQPLDVATILGVFATDKFKKFLKEVNNTWQVPIEIKVPVPEKVEPLRASVQFLSSASRGLLPQYIAGALQGKAVTTGSVAAIALATKEHEAWQGYLKVLNDFGFQLRLVNLPRHTQLLKDPTLIPESLAASQARLAQIKDSIASLTAEKKAAHGKDRKPFDHKIVDLERERDEVVIGRSHAQPILFTHDDVQRLAITQLPAGELTFPALLITQSNKEQFTSVEANARLAALSPVLTDLLEKKAAFAVQNLDALEAYHAALVQHESDLRALQGVAETPISIRALDPAVKDRVNALQERIKRYEDGKLGKTGKALRDYDALKVDPRKPPTEPRWDSIPLDGIGAFESKVKKAIGRLQKKTTNTARGGEEDDTQEFSERTLKDWQATLEEREERHHKYHWMTFNGGPIVRTVLGSKGSNLKQISQLTRIDGLKTNTAQNGQSVSIGIPVGTSAKQLELVQSLLARVAAQAEALRPTHLIGDKRDHPIFGHDVVQQIFTALEKERGQTTLSPAELVQLVVKEVGGSTATAAPVVVAASHALPFESEHLAQAINEPPEQIKSALAEWKRELGALSLKAVAISGGYNLEVSPIPQDPAHMERARGVLTYLENVLTARTFLAGNDIEQARHAARETYLRLRQYTPRSKGLALQKQVMSGVLPPNVDEVAYFTSTDDANFLEARIVMQQGVPGYCGKESSFLSYLAGHDAWTVFQDDKRLRGLKIKTENRTIVFTGTTPERIRTAVDLFQAYVTLVDEHKGSRNFPLATLLQVAMGNHKLPDPNSEAAIRGITTPALLRSVIPNIIEPKSDNQHAYMHALENYPVVIVIGRAGTGKGFLAGHESVVDQCGGKVEQTMWSNFMAKQGASLGALPGDFLQKLQFLYAPFIENYIKSIIGPEVKKNQALRIVTELMKDSGLPMPGFNSIDILDPRFAMGRTLDHSNVYIDEAQLMPKSFMEVLIQRVGEGTKLRIMGSLDQIIDPGIHKRPFTDPEGCGLAFALYCAVHVPEIRRISAIVFLDSEADVKRSEVAAVWGEGIHTINSRKNLGPAWKDELLAEAMPHALRYDPVTKLVLPAAEHERRRGAEAIRTTSTGVAASVVSATDISKLPMLRQPVFKPNGGGNGSTPADSIR